jgi:hypothetical protein
MLGSHSYEEFCLVTPSSPVKVNRRFGGTYLHSEGRRASNHQDITSKSDWLLGLLCDSEDVGSMFLRKIMDLYWLHGVIPQKIIYFMVKHRETKGLQSRNDCSLIYTRLPHLFLGTCVPLPPGLSCIYCIYANARLPVPLRCRMK